MQVTSHYTINPLPNRVKKGPSRPVELSPQGAPSPTEKTEISSSQKWAPGAPGQASTWTNGNKDGVGTSADRRSPVWFSLSEGRMTEVYYPKVDQANSKELKFILSDGKNFSLIDHEAGQTRVELTNDSSLGYRYITELPEQGLRLTKTYCTDPETASVMVNIKVDRTGHQNSQTPLQLYAVHEVAIHNSGMHDQGEANPQGLSATEGDTSLVLRADRPFTQASVGYHGASDNVEHLLKNHQLGTTYTHASPGNLTQIGRVELHPGKDEVSFALSFGKTPQEAQQTAEKALAEPFSQTLEQYQKGWSDYLGSLKPIPTQHPEQLNLAAMTLKAHEDKIHEGAMIASLTIPWGHTRNNANEGEGGYHLVWGRDLYQVATAFMSLGDNASAERALDYMFKVQQRPDGSVPQNTWLDGTPYWKGLQMDQVAFPLILAHELGRHDLETYQKHVKPAAEFVANNGPFSPQERWEEQAGLSPSTIAAEIAGLVCAAEIADKNGDGKLAEKWRAKADHWVANLENWLVTQNGPYGDGEYYLRVNDDLDPNDGDARDMKNGGGLMDERRVVDVGFLELVRLGIKAADDPIIKKSMQVIDQVTKVDTPNGPGYYRYSAFDEQGERIYVDGYGEKADGEGFVWEGRGRLWPFLTGEVGQWQLAQGDTQKANESLDTMARMANEGRALPEQVWDQPTNDWSKMTPGRASKVLHDNFGWIDNAAGLGTPNDQLIGRADIKAVIAHPETSPLLKQAGEYVLSNGEVFAELDSQAGKYGHDGLISHKDLKAIKNLRAKELAPESLVFGEGTGSATPLAWTNAQFIRLAANLASGRNEDTPQVVAERYLQKKD